MEVPNNLPGAERWKNLRSLGMVIRRRLIKGGEQQDVQYYISGSPVKVSRLAETIRGHWLIENQLHWMLDVFFCIVRKPHSPGNDPEIS